ncbi:MULTISPECIES: DUF2986 domain-containing protein [Shewanella]|jgi:hypothetical protein|uniref:DUF2986 domain-containing protein n=1 Tax=Shewanella TaxID=22 RepID=UPI000C5D6B7B|nr:MULTISPECIES: DUF2986 domain-containing protein [Shewanella]NCQ46501.1 DUF2986 domain-containing protein [Shewanella frigidimarina]MBB1390362.1 DUF2986 domain-containing protein [Shewanella sp. SG44-6]NCO72733.1 DUF2986 domain-containing protein [Shewanella vesiculosa]NCP38202.1 DUF2986 domain-containing protein [Shewanella vesiculosa]NCP70673.1 DUF2986 domain-containing protein [Shewanella vesiculosa]
MNRKKKINQTLKAKAKKANAKLHAANKSPYIAKADREKLMQAQLIAAPTVGLADSESSDTDTIQ